MINQIFGSLYKIMESGHIFLFEVVFRSYTSGKEITYQVILLKVYKHL